MPCRAQLSHSASSTKPRSSRAEYSFPFTSSVLPLEAPFAGDSVVGGKAFKEGCSNDVRELWADVSNDGKWPADR